MVQGTREVASKATSAVSWNIEEHLLKEKLHFHNNVFNMKMGLISPVYSSRSGDRKAWASTLQVELVAPSPESNENVIPFL